MIVVDYWSLPHGLGMPEVYMAEVCSFVRGIRVAASHPRNTPAEAVAEAVERFRARRNR